MTCRLDLFKTPLLKYEVRDFKQVFAAIDKSDFFYLTNLLVSPLLVSISNRSLEN